LIQAGLASVVMSAFSLPSSSDCTFIPAMYYKRTLPYKDSSSLLENEKQLVTTLSGRGYHMRTSYFGYDWSSLTINCQSSTGLTSEANHNHNILTTLACYVAWKSDGAAAKTPEQAENHAFRGSDSS